MQKSERRLENEISSNKVKTQKEKRKSFRLNPLDLQYNTYMFGLVLVVPRASTLTTPL